MGEHPRLGDAIAILERLVAFATVTGGPNLDLIDWVGEVLRACGATVVVLHADSGDRANLFATLGTPRDGGVLLSAHGDVVPADAAEWSTPPFVLSARGSRLHGRGSTDMKGFLAVVLAWMRGLDPVGLKVPVHLALTYDEELGCLGVPHLTSELGRTLPRPAVAIVGEPTGMQPVIGHRGYRAYRTNLTGVAAHSGDLAHGVSAIRLAAAVLTGIEALAWELAAADAALRRPCEDLVRATVNAGTIAGGIATNIVAPSCAIEWEIRTVDDAVADAALDRLQQLVAAALPKDLVVAGGMNRIATVETAREPVFFPEKDGMAMLLIAPLVATSTAGTVGFGTEAGFFQAAGLSTVVIGPGNIGRAHRADEFIETGELAAALRFLDALEDRLRERGLDAG